MSRQYMVVVQQLWLNETGSGTTYSREGRLFDHRAEAIDYGWRELEHDDFNIATVDDGRLVAFGWALKDFGTDDGYDLDEIARHLCMPGPNTQHEIEE